MGMIDYFKPIPSMSCAEVRRFLLEHDPEDFNLLDVRQPKEYEQGHLPGATLIPVNTLPDRLAEFDPKQPTITYCAAGPRSRSAAANLIHAGFERVYVMDGGIRAWEGITAEGDPASQLAYFSSARNAVEYLALAWLLEDGSRAFYAAAAEQLEDVAESSFLRQMVAAEDHHKATLAAAYRELTGELPGKTFPRPILESPPEEQYVEGGLALSDVLAWLKGKPATAIIEFAIGMEANAYDHYLLLRRKIDNETARGIFSILADEERNHLRTLTNRLDRFLEGN